MIPAWVNGDLQPIEKLKVHELGLKHKAVSVFVTRGDDILLQRRASSKYHTPGLWANTCCTHPMWDEEPEACAVRRLDDELGIAGLAPIYSGQVEYRADVGNGLIEHEVVQVFITEAPADLSWSLNPEEVSEVRWINRVTLIDAIQSEPHKYTPWLSIYLAEHSAMIFGEPAIA